MASLWTSILAGWGAGKLSAGGKGGGLREVSTLSPEQQAVIGKLGPYLSERVGLGLPSYTGTFTAPLSELEQLGLDQAKDYVTSGLTPLTSQGLGAYSEALKGLDINQVTDFFNTNFRPVQEREFREQVLPAVRESFVGPGTFRSSGRQEAEARSAERFGESNLSQIGQMVLAEREGSRNLLQFLPSISALQEEAPLRRAEAGAAFGNIPRAVEQAELASQYGEFQRTQPELNPVIDQALQMLGIQTKAAYFDPGKPNQILEILKALAPIAGAAIGTAIAPGIGTAAGAAAGRGIGRIGT